MSHLQQNSLPLGSPADQLELSELADPLVRVSKKGFELLEIMVSQALGKQLGGGITRPQKGRILWL